MSQRFLTVATSVGAALLLFGISVATQPAPFDVIVRGGRVLDGSGNPYIYADVGIRGDTIVAVGDLRNASAARIVDATGQYVTPGFLALHEHIEPAILKGHGTLPNFTTQGFTTAVIDADGRTVIWPLTKQRAELERAGSGLNLVPMVGHGTVRGMAMGSDYMRPATAAEIDRMKQLVRQGMEEGAFGLSAGLEYIPGRWSAEEEVLELAKIVAPFGGHYQAHLRSQGQHPKWQLPSYPEKPITNTDAVMETITIARRANIPAMLDHLHPKGPREWGSGRIVTQLVDRAWREGHQVYISMHSYEAYDENIVLRAVSVQRRDHRRAGQRAVRGGGWEADGVEARPRARAAADDQRAAVGLRAYGLWPSPLRVYRAARAFATICRTFASSVGT